jgi:hypothetical protein
MLGLALLVLAILVTRRERRAKTGRHTDATLGAGSSSTATH